MTFTIVNRTLKKYEGNDERVVIPEGVTAVDDYAFYGARSLRYLTIPDTVREIGNNVFYDCESLEEITLPDSITYMGSGLFSRCAGLKKAVLPSRIRSLPNITFYQCVSLEEVSLPSSVTRVGRAAFQQCASLRKLRLPASLKVLEDNVFDDCVSLMEADIPEGTEAIGDNVFYQCSGLRLIRLPSSLKKVGKGAFETRGKLSIRAEGDLRLRSRMFDNNWNMNWNFGSNGRYNGRNEDNYQLFDSYLPNVDLKEWKPEARCILGINYLETYRDHIGFYEEWITENRTDFLDAAVGMKRWEALNRSVGLGLIEPRMLEGYMERIDDPQERAIVLEYVKNSRSDLDDLFDMLGGGS